MGEHIPGGVDFHIRLVGDVPTPRVSIFRKKFQNRVENASKTSRTGISKAYNFPEPVKLVLNARLVIKNNDFVHWYVECRMSNVECRMSNVSREQRQKNFPT